LRRASCRPPSPRRWDEAAICQNAGLKSSEIAGIAEAQRVARKEVGMHRFFRTRVARGRLACAGLAIVSLLVAIGCASIAHGSRQAIEIRSSPPGARVLIKGRDTGITPAVVSVKRKDSSVVLRLEKDGYKPVEITLKRATSRWVAGDIAWSAGQFVNQGYSSTGQAAAGAVATLAIGVGVDALTGAAYKQVPGEVHVTLEELPRKP